MGILAHASRLQARRIRRVKTPARAPGYAGGGCTTDTPMNGWMNPLPAAARFVKSSIGGGYYDPGSCNNTGGPCRPPDPESRYGCDTQDCNVQGQRRQMWRERGPQAAPQRGSCSGGCVGACIS